MVTSWHTGMMGEFSRIGIKGVVFDVNETLSDMSPMADAFHAVGAPPGLAKAWFAGVLRDGFALSTTGGASPFADIAETHLRTVLAPVALNCSIEQATTTILERMRNLSLHPDAADGIRSLTAAGLRLMTLSNGSTDIAESLFSEAGIRDVFSYLLSVEGVSLWKPASQAYRIASAASGLAAEELLLVAVHPWDIHGAHRAGMRTAWITRSDEPYPAYFAAPDLVVRSVPELADVLRAKP